MTQAMMYTYTVVLPFIYSSMGMYKFSQIWCDQNILSVVLKPVENNEIQKWPHLVKAAAAVKRHLQSSVIAQKSSIVPV